VVRPLRLPEASPEPAPRAYHSLAALGRYLVLFGGRCSGDLVHGDEKLAVFDPVSTCWTMLGERICRLRSRIHVLGAKDGQLVYLTRVLLRSAGAAATEGTPLTGRSSHRCVALGDRLIFMGGSPADSDEETNALRTLRIAGSGFTAKWSFEDEPQSSLRPPGVQQDMSKRLLGLIINSNERLVLLTGRSAHGLAVVDDVVWVVGGYGTKAADSPGNGQASRGSKYVKDVWRLQLRPSEPTAPPSPRAHPQ